MMKIKVLKNLTWTNIKKYPACRYGYKLVCVDNKFSKSFKPYLGEDAFYILLII